MLKRTRIKKRRSKPRRGRVHDPDFVAFVAATGICIVKLLAPEIESWTGYSCRGRLTIHHVREYGSPKDDRKILLLCEGHHQHDFGEYCIERGKKRFEQTFGIDIQKQIATYNEDYGVANARLG